MDMDGRCGCVGVVDGQCIGACRGGRNMPSTLPRVWFGSHMLPIFIVPCSVLRVVYCPRDYFVLRLFFTGEGPSAM